MQLPGYRFYEKIGAGGMAVIYKGEQLSLARPVAVKILNRQMRQHSQVREAFERESFIIARLNHPNIIQVIDRGVAASGTPYFIMEYIDGMDLSRIMRGGELSVEKKIEVCLHIARALGYAHKNGVIHRDIKPGNIIVDKEFHVKVLDFGIALFYESTGANGLNGTAEQDVMGTLTYSAPELTDGVGDATISSDLYSFGVVMYELFAGENPVAVPEALNRFPASLPKLLQSLILQCLAKTPSRRPQSAAVVHDRLLMLLQGAHLDRIQAARARESFDKKTFTLLDILSEGEYGAVYLFMEKGSGRHLIVKKRNQTHQGFAISQRMAELDHPNIAKVYGASKNARAYITVMCYLNGGSLKDRLIRPYVLDAFLPIAGQLCSGLIYAHNNHIYHGNLRLSNVLFDDKGNVQITDFGLPPHYQSAQNTPADSIKEPVENQRQASTDGKKAKPHVQKQNWYSVLKEPSSIQGDIFACGVIFYQMLTGELPRWQQGMLRKTALYCRLPKKLQALLFNMLQRRTQLRYQHFYQIQAVLDELGDSLPTRLINPSPKKPASVIAKAQSDKKQVLLLLLLVLFFLVLVDTGAIVLYSNGYFEVDSMQNWFDSLFRK